MDVNVVAFFVLASVSIAGLVVTWYFRKQDILMKKAQQDREQKRNSAS